jgi:hypothetical protein
VYATKGINTAAIGISSVGRQNLADKLRNIKSLECFMDIPSDVSYAINPDQRCARRQACIVRPENIARNPGNPYEDVGKSRTESGLLEQISFKSTLLGYQRCCCARTIRATTYIEARECGGNRQTLLSGYTTNKSNRLVMESRD